MRVIECRLLIRKIDESAMPYRWAMELSTFGEGGYTLASNRHYECVRTARVSAKRLANSLGWSIVDESIHVESAAPTA